MMKLLGVNGSMSNKSRTLVLVKQVLDVAGEQGASTTLLNLSDYPLPIFAPQADYSENEVVLEVQRLVEEADALIVGTPEYHACMSGATKNFFDFLYRQISGKLFGLVAASGGGNGASAFTNLRATVLCCHGWVMPYNVGATGTDFDKEGQLVNSRVDERLRRMARDLIVYGPLLHQQFQDDLAQPADAPPGFAHWIG
ncbi:NADPH-dependent FMN reductase [candidate division BRC1 bacterium HGW-BRC1-1]|jgi:FMN reductase|nr:MAG: NADPH-dependent FMN reductase [candidate division BRC1 bacterium HGW-BRC1-1]